MSQSRSDMILSPFTLRHQASEDCRNIQQQRNTVAPQRTPSHTLGKRNLVPLGPFLLALLLLGTTGETFAFAPSLLALQKPTMRFVCRNHHSPSFSRWQGFVRSSTALQMATNSRELRFMGATACDDDGNGDIHQQQNKKERRQRQHISITDGHAGWFLQQATAHLTSATAATSHSSSSLASLFSVVSSAHSTTTTSTKIYHSSSLNMASRTAATTATTASTTSVRLGGAAPSMATTNTLFKSFSSIGNGGGGANGANNRSTQARPVYQGYGASLQLTDEERELFALLRRFRKDRHLETTLRVAGGWVRDKLLATPEFRAYHAVFEVAGKRLTSKFRPSSSAMAARQYAGTHASTVLTANEAGDKPVDIDIALDDLLGREFAEQLNAYLHAQEGKVDTPNHSAVGVVMQNPEKSKHLETATMKVGNYWIDFVNLRAEEYTCQDSRIPDLMRIGTASEDAYRRDLTINSLFYNINTGQVEDWTGRGFSDLQKGVVATPLSPLTTLLDDPLRVLRSIRFAARLRFTMDEELMQAAKDVRVQAALAQKVSRERIGSEVDLMLQSPDPVGAMRLLHKLDLMTSVFPQLPRHEDAQEGISVAEKGLSLLSTAHDHLADCKWSPPVWCRKSDNMPSAKSKGGFRLLKDEEPRRLLWYAAFLKPLYDHYNQEPPQPAADPKTSRRAQSRKQKRKKSPVQQLLVDELKRPTRDAEAMIKILKAADEITHLMKDGALISATMILSSDINILAAAPSVDDKSDDSTQLSCFMSGRLVDSTTVDDPVWTHAMEFRLKCSQLLQRIGPLWRAALVLSLCEELNALQQDEALSTRTEECSMGGGDYDDELRRGIIERYDIFAASLMRLGLVQTSSSSTCCWNVKPLLDGTVLKRDVLPNIPKGPTFRSIMDEQNNYMATHPGASPEGLAKHLQAVFPDFGPPTSN